MTDSLRLQPLLRCKQLKASTKRVRFYVVTEEPSWKVQRADLSHMKRRPKESLCKLFLRFLFPRKGHKVSLWEDETKSTMDIVVGLDRLFVFRDDVNDAHHLTYFAGNSGHILFNAKFAPDETKLTEDDSPEAQQILRWIRKGEIKAEAGVDLKGIQKRLDTARQKRETARDLASRLGPDIANMIVSHGDPELVANDKTVGPRFSGQRTNKALVDLILALSAEFKPDRTIRLNTPPKLAHAPATRLYLFGKRHDALFTSSILGLSFDVNVVQTGREQTFILQNVKVNPRFIWKFYDPLDLVESFARECDAYYTLMQFQDWRQIKALEFEGCDLSQASVSLLFAEFVKQQTFLVDLHGFRLAHVDADEVTFSKKQRAIAQEVFAGLNKTWPAIEQQVVAETLKDLNKTMDPEKEARELEEWLLVRHPKSKQYIKPRKPAPQSVATLRGALDYFVDANDCATVAKLMENVEIRFWQHFVNSEDLPQKNWTWVKF